MWYIYLCCQFIDIWRGVLKFLYFAFFLEFPFHSWQGWAEQQQEAPDWVLWRPPPGVCGRQESGLLSGT